MKTGVHEAYDWFEFSANTFISHVIEKCPEIFVQRYLVVTAFDSGPLSLSKDQEKAGWIRRGELAYSPRLATLNDLQSGEFDEWYIFDRPVTDQWQEVFVNDGGWTLAPSENSAVQALQSRFWTLCERLQPETYIADGTALMVVTRNDDMATSIKTALGKL